MATGLKSRIIYRVKTKEDTETDYWAGEYQLLIRAKTIPSPIGTPNMVDVSTLEDLVVIQEPGRKEANSMEIEGAFEKKYKDALVDIEGEDLDLIILYGTDGKGSEGKLAFIGSEYFSPNEATDDHLTGTITVSTSSTPIWIDDDYDVTVEEDSLGYPTKITLTVKTGG